MMLAEITEKLKAEHDELAGEVKTLQQDLKTKQTELTRIAAALKELGGKSAKRKPAGITTEAVVSLIERALQQGRRLKTEQIKAGLEKHLEDSGQAKTGLHLRLKSALQDERFRIADGAWSLVNGASPPPVPR